MNKIKILCKRYLFWRKVRMKFCELVNSTPSKLKAPHIWWTDADRLYSVDIFKGKAVVNNGSYAKARLNLDTGHVILDDTPDFDGCCRCNFTNMYWDSNKKNFVILVHSDTDDKKWLE